MNIVTPYPNFNLNTANVYTESARRDSQIRELIPETKQLPAGQLDPKQLSDNDKNRLQGAFELEASQESTENETAEAIEGDAERDEQNGEQSQQSASERREQEQQQEEAEQLKELKARDAEVRAHEMAHATVGGQYAGSPSYEFQRGPDGRNYAVGGEVPIDISIVPGDPQQTIDKMQQVKAAALAPAEPSGKDREIARDAVQKIAEAKAELATQIFEVEGQEIRSDSESPIAPPGRQQTEFADLQFQRPQEVDERAARIASFYQAATSPNSPSRFDRII